jgi:DNA-binding SARP family transcriptional activator
MSAANFGERGHTGEMIEMRDRGPGRSYDHSSVNINILGLLEVSEGARRFNVPGEKLRTILAVLAINASRSVPRDQLVEELWVDFTPANAGNAVQAHIARIRKLFRYWIHQTEPADIIRTTGSGYMLCLPEEAIDSNRFLRIVTEVRGFMFSQPAKAIDRLEQAFRLWRGPALIDTSEGPLCRSVAFRLDSARLHALEDLIEAKLAVGLDASLVPELEQLVAQHPLRERLADQLMRALYQCGRQADALSTYQRTRQRLVKELGIEPSRLLQTRMQEILNHDPSLIQTPS